MSRPITVVRIYLMEGDVRVDDLLRMLHDEERVPGVTVLRAIEGYGASDHGEIHTSSLLTLSLELPLIVEFFCRPERASEVIDKLADKLKLKHIISWQAVGHLID